MVIKERMQEEVWRLIYLLITAVWCGIQIPLAYFCIHIVIQKKHKRSLQWHHSFMSTPMLTCVTCHYTNFYLSQVLAYTGWTKWAWVSMAFFSQQVTAISHSDITSFLEGNPTPYEIHYAIDRCKAVCVELATRNGQVRDRNKFSNIGQWEVLSVLLWLLSLVLLIAISSLELVLALVESAKNGCGGLDDSVAWQQQL